MKIPFPPLLAALALALGTVPPVFGETGYTSANFLKIGMGARAAAMGDAFTAVADDTSAIYWNPAGLALVRGLGISATQGEWLLGVQNEFLAVSEDLGRDGTVGLSLITDQTSAFLSTLQAPGGGYGGTGSSVSALDGQVSAAYAACLGNFTGGGLFQRTYVGLKANFVFQNAAGNLGNGLSFDFGLLQRLADIPLTLGLDLQNVGTGIQDRALPVLVKAGAAWRLDHLFTRQDWATVAADLDYPSDSYLHPSLGLEYRRPLGSMLASLRAGARTTDDLQGFSFLTVGAGLAKSFEGLAVSIDYALAPYGVLGLTHRFTLNVLFPGSPSAVEAQLSGPPQFTAGQTAPLDLAVKSEKEISSWTLAFTNAQGAEVAMAEGKGNPPSRYAWNGGDKAGRPVPEGSYQAVLSVQDMEGNAAKSKPLELKALPPAPSPSATVEARVEKPAKPEPEKWSLSGDALFEPGKAELNPEGLDSLREAASKILKHPDDVIEISGHTDNTRLKRTASFKDNQELSEARAASVKAFLVSQGVDADHLKTAGYGDQKPVAPNTTREGRALNRRVEFKLLEKAVPPPQGGDKK